MAQAGYTPIQIYYSTTTTNTPSAGNLADGELAINTADGKLFYKDNLGAVQVIATKAAVTNVSSISFGSTGLTPSTATTGAVTVAGTLAVANGGTNATATPTAGAVAYGTGTAYAFTAAGTAGQVLQSNGASAPTWVNAATGDVTAAGNNAFTGANTFYNATGQTFGTATSTQDGILIKGRAGGTSTYRVTLIPDTLSASRTITFPNADINFTTGLGVAQGGTGQTTYTNGQLLIGNTTGNTLTKATLTAGTGISITNGTGSITIATTGGGGGGSGGNIFLATNFGGF